MLWLYDANRQETGVLDEYASLITERTFEEWPTLKGRFPESAFTALMAAEYATVADEDEVYVLGKVDLKREETSLYVEVEGESAASLLHQRTVVDASGNVPMSWTNAAAGQIVSDLLDTLTGDRALPLVFGDGIALGTGVNLQVSWGDMGDTVLELLAAETLGIRTRLDGTDIVLDVYGPVATTVLLGEKYGNASGFHIGRDEREWRNYAVVLGEGEGAARVRVDVDLTGSDPRREMYVDARDLQRTVDEVEMSLAAYQALLTQRGREKLAETRVIEYVEATTDLSLGPGDTAWYDSRRYSGSLMVTRAMVAREGGTITRTGTLGEAPVVEGRRAVKRVAKRWGRNR